MNDLIVRLDECLRANRPEYYEHLLPGLSIREIQEYEHLLGYELPADFRMLYQWKNGQREGSHESLYWNQALMRLDDIVESWNITNDVYEGSDRTAEPSLWWTSAWIPFMQNFGGDHYCLDMAGSFGGHKGKIIWFLHDDSLRVVQFPSLKNWLETIVVTQKAGFVDWDEDGDMWEMEGYKEIFSQINPGYPKDFQRRQ